MKLINEFGNITMEIHDEREINRLLKDGWKVDESKAELILENKTASAVENNPAKKPTTKKAAKK